MNDTESQSGTAHLQYLSANLLKGLTTSDFRSEFKQELLRTVVHDRDEVWTKLLDASDALSMNDTAMNEVCAAVKKRCKEDIADLLALAKKADSGRGQSQADEVKMYKPLQNIFSAVEHSLVQLKIPRRAYRQLVLTSSHALPKEVSSHNVDIKPDFVVVDVPPPVRRRSPSAPVPAEDAKWTRCSAFIEVKARSSEVPTNSKSNDATNPLTQAADYARIILAARPFQLNAYGALFCGHKFVLALFDRRGVVVSSSCSIKDPQGFKQFIRLLVRLIWDATSVELGLDPTVSLQPGHSYYQDTSAQYPRFEIRTGDPRDPSRWVTYEPPVWTSPSLIGRGTSVWRTLGPASNDATVVKTSWRSENRMSETRIYEAIAEIYKRRSDPVPRGMAECRHGGDVHFNGRVISAYRLREPLPFNSGSADDPHKPAPLNPQLRVSGGEPDAVLHRITIMTVGKPLWEYTDLKQLAKALYMVIYAHKDLCDHGIIHRDISAGNILIRVHAKVQTSRERKKNPGDPVITWSDTEETEGFLTDFEIAKLPESTSSESSENAEEPVVSNPPATTVSTPMQGDAITGTAIFMATKLLIEIAKAQAKNLPTVHVFRGREYDVESFYWVIIYVIYKRALFNDELKKDANSLKELTQEFCTLFSARSTQRLAIARKERLSQSEGENRCVGISALLRYLESYEDPQHRAATVEFVQDLWKELRTFLPRDALLSEAEKAVINRKLATKVRQAHRLGQEPPTLESVLLKFNVGSGPSFQADHMGLLSIVFELLQQLGEGEWEAAFHETEDARRKAAAPTADSKESEQ